MGPDVSVRLPLPPSRGTARVSRAERGEEETMRRLTTATLALVLASVLHSRPAGAVHSQAGEAGLALGAAAANLVYLPVKTLVAVGGLGVGALTGLLTGGDTRAAYALWVPTTGGTFLLTPGNFDGTRPIEFFGSDYADRPSTNARDSSIAYRALYMY